MISIQLPDGSKREYPGPVTVAEVAASIGTGLAKAALGGRVGQGNTVHLVDKGRIIASGSYEELLERSAAFQKLVLA